MNRSLLVVLFCVVTFASASLGNATIIGDVITINRLYPDLSTIYLPPADSIPGFVTVTAVVGPEASPSSPQPSLYSIDFEANTISFDFVGASTFVGAPGPIYNLSTPFDGLQFLGFSDPIQNATVQSVSGISVVELFFAADQIFLNLNGTFTADASLVLQVDFSPTGVPEPNLVLLLGAMTALGCLVGRRRG